MRRLLGLALVAALLSSVATPAAARTPRTVPTLPVETLPPLTARAWILHDDTYGLTLSARDPDLALPMASTTKIMTALLAAELGEPDQPVVVSERAADVGEAEIGLVAGEVLPLGALVRTLLIRSANDAAVAVAEALAGSVEGFVEMMNTRAAELGLADTSFVNPHGLDAPGHHSSPRDLLVLARTAMSVPELAEAVAATRFRLPDAPDGTPRVAVATNHLLTEYPGAIGVKTGFTFQAGLVLVAAAERDGRRLYAVVMGSEGERAHFRDAVELLDHGFEGYRIIPSVMAGVPFHSQPDEAGLLDHLALAETRVHLAAAGLSGVGGTPPVAPPDPLPEPAPVGASADPLPSLADAARWVTRYWRMLVADG